MLIGIMIMEIVKEIIKVASLGVHFLKCFIQNTNSIKVKEDIMNSSSASKINIPIASLEEYEDKQNAIARTNNAKAERRAPANEKSKRTVRSHTLFLIRHFSIISLEASSFLSILVI